MSLIASPVSPKAVVWKRRGRVMMHHFRMSTKVRKDSLIETTTNAYLGARGSVVAG